MHEEGDHATKNQLSGVLLQGDGLEERLEQWECILHDQHGRLLPQRLANGPLHHHHFAQIRRKEEAPLCEPTHVEKSATSKISRWGQFVGEIGHWKCQFSLLRITNGTPRISLAISSVVEPRIPFRGDMQKPPYSGRAMARRTSGAREICICRRRAGGKTPSSISHSRSSTRYSSLM